jgi:hypothetical protein
MQTHRLKGPFMTTNKRTRWNSNLPAPTKPLKRKTAVKKRNAVRIKKRREEAFGGKAEFVRSLPCVACPRFGIIQMQPTEAAHARSRGAGGKADALIPLCSYCHACQHNLGVRTFENRTGLDLMFVAAKVEMDWMESGGRAE